LRTFIRFAAIDSTVYDLYGPSIHAYFSHFNISLTVCIIPGEEVSKTLLSLEKILSSLVAFSLHRRSPFYAIGGGVLLDVAGMAASMYRRGVPFVRVPTTLLAIVDASVGVKNGLDYCCAGGSYKNRIGTFYAPSSVLVSPTTFLPSLSRRNLSNGCGEIMKLALVRSTELFELLEEGGEELLLEGERLLREGGFGGDRGDRIIHMSIRIMLEELGPNLWETKLDRPVDYGHTFSKLIEMVPGADLMHGEAVNIDGFFCAVLSYNRGWIDEELLRRIKDVSDSLELPTHSELLTKSLCMQSLLDATEHRHGKQRVPLLSGLGSAESVSDIDEIEIQRALETMKIWE